MSAEQAARKTIDGLLRKAGWHVCDFRDADLHASRGVAIREFPLAAPAQSNPGTGRADAGYADYLLYVDGKVVDIIEAKKAGPTARVALAAPRRLGGPPRSALGQAIRPVHRPATTQ